MQKHAARTWVNHLDWLWLDRKAAEPQMSPPGSVARAGALFYVLCVLLCVGLALVLCHCLSYCRWNVPAVPAHAAQVQPDDLACESC